MLLAQRWRLLGADGVSAEDNGGAGRTYPRSDVIDPTLHTGVQFGKADLPRPVPIEIAFQAVILAVIAGWLALTRLRSRGQGWQQATLDLRGHEPLRGSQTVNPAPPLVLPHGRLDLTIDLPVGSEAGHYDVQVIQDGNRTVGGASGAADLVDGLTVLKTRVDLRQASLGPSSLLVRRAGQSWAKYGILIE